MVNILKQLWLFKKFYLNSHTPTGPEKQTDFTMHLETVDIARYNQALKESIFANKVIESVRYNSKDFPIFQLDWGNADSDKRLLILAGVHGNEFAGTLSILDILNDVKKHADKYAPWNIRIIAPVNPVGLVYQSRYDQDGYDLNRDFKEFCSVGARLQREVIEDFKPTIVVTMHESPDEGFYMFSEGRLPQQFKTAIATKLTSASIPLAKTNFLHITLQAGLWEKPPIIFAIQRMLGIYTLGRFLYERNIPTITTESTWCDKDIAARRKPHTLVVQAVLET